MSRELIFEGGIGRVLDVYGKLVSKGDKILLEKNDFRYNRDGLIENQDFGNYEYELDFYGLLTPGQTFGDLVKIRPNGERAVMDLFGGGYFIPDLDCVEHMIGVRLQNVDQMYLQSYEEGSEWQSRYKDMRVTLQYLMESPKRTVIEANLYRRKSDLLVREEMKRRNIKSFGVIVARPEAGIFGRKLLGQFHDTNVSSLGNVFLPILDRAYRLLSFNNGVLYTQIPDFQNDMVLEELKEFLSCIPGISVNFVDVELRTTLSVPFSMCLLKSNEAPKSLL